MHCAAQHHKKFQIHILCCRTASVGHLNTSQLQPATQMQWPALLSQGVTKLFRSTTNLKVRSSHTAMTQRLSISYASHP